MNGRIKNILLSLLLLSVSLYSQSKDWTEKSENLFSKATTEHFTINYFDYGYAANHINNIVDDREAGYSNLADFFNFDLDRKVNLYFFPDEETKFQVTGHKGMGWGYNYNIVEVLNDSIKVDPFHELAHIFIYRIGKPPALIDEGLAVYLSDKFGYNGLLELLGYKGQTINEVLQIHLADKKLIPITSLYKISDIGESQNVILAYLESASFVEYIISQFGKDKLIELIFELENTKSIDMIEIFKSVYNNDLISIEAQWKNKLYSIN